MDQNLSVGFLKSHLSWEIGAFFVKSSCKQNYLALDLVFNLLVSFPQSFVFVMCLKCFREATLVQDLHVSHTSVFLQQEFN